MLEEVEKECDLPKRTARARAGKEGGRGETEGKVITSEWKVIMDGLAQFYLCFSGALPPFFAFSRF